MRLTEFQRHLKCVNVDRLLKKDLLLREGRSVAENPDETYRNLRFERYAAAGSGARGSLFRTVIRNSYYAVRPFLPVRFRKYLQRFFLQTRQGSDFPSWPTDMTIERVTEEILGELLEYLPEGLPFIWFWPEGRSACLLMTHDVETGAGVEFLPHMMELESVFGLQSSVEIIPEERYPVDDALLDSIRAFGNEICVHGLNHDGQLFSSEEIFMSRALRINSCLERFGARGFRSPVLYRNLDWLGELAVEYDMSVPNSARYDPQPGGCCTVFPYFIGNIVEIPLTMVQDYTLFHLLGRTDLDVWTGQLSEIRDRSGLMTFNIHPDYVSSGPYYNLYMKLLLKIRKFITDENIWNPLPIEVARWWRQRDAMSLVKSGESWKVTGMGSGRAAIAVLKLDEGKAAVEVYSGNSYISAK